jgi:DNA polymerase
MRHKVTIDFETYSECDIKTHGLSRYIHDPSTLVYMLAWKIDDGPEHLWVPWDDQGPEEMPAELDAAIAAGYEVHAHNAAFEILVWRVFMVRRYGWRSVPSSQWRCTAAKCAYANLPRSLKLASKALALGDDGKDTEGHKLMLKLCRPQRGRRVFDAPLQLRLGGYCKQDVHAESAVDQQTPKFPARELTIWRLDRKINDRGVPVDLDLCRGAVKILDEANKLALERLRVLTAGTITSINQIAKLKEFVESRGVYLPRNAKGTASLGKEALDALDDMQIEDQLAREVLDLRRKCSLASVKKMKATLDWADTDSRVRNTLNYYSAGPGRWGGRGPQFQNMVRAKTPSDAELIAITSGDYDAAVAATEGGDVFDLISRATRSIIMAPAGRQLNISDFAGIECRVLHWLVGDEATLDRFRNNEDLYVVMACKIFNCQPSDILDPATGKARDDTEAKFRRQVGKVAVLGLGYQMGAGKFAGSCKSMAGVIIDEQLAESVVEIYRMTNPLVVDFWRAVEDSAAYCVKTRKAVVCGKVRFRMEGPWMALTLPSGRDLYYFNPRLAIGKFGQPVVAYDSHKGRVDLYGGLTTENIVQGTARDLLADALVLLERKAQFTVLHVHDEAVTESELTDEDAPNILHATMEHVAPWAEGCPVAAETHSSIRYTK